MMKAMSTEAGLSKVYTNHSIRATAIVALNKAGVQDRIICSLSGHRNTQSLKSYCSDASTGQKREMTQILSDHGKACKAVKSKKPCHTVSAPPSSAAEHPAATTCTTSRVASSSATIQVTSTPRTLPVNHEPLANSPTDSLVTPTTAMISSLLSNAVSVPRRDGEPPVFNFNFAGASVNFIMPK